MARFARAVAVGAAHHITQRGVDQQRVFFTDADRHTYLDCLQTYSAQARLRILAYCLMSNHIHLVAIPDEPQSSPWRCAALMAVTLYTSTRAAIGWDIFGRIASIPALSTKRI